jgi:hypothetical protein
LGATAEPIAPCAACPGDWDPVLVVSPPSGVDVRQELSPRLDHCPLQDLALQVPTVNRVVAVKPAAS